MAGNVLLSDVASGTDLSSFDRDTYPSLTLRANYKTHNKGISPRLNAWHLTWTATEPSLADVFLPVICNNHNQ
jgi:hypothetical protein